MTVIWSWSAAESASCPGIGLYLCMLGGLLLILTGLVVCCIHKETGEAETTGDEA